MEASLRNKVIELKFAKRYGEAVNLIRSLADRGDSAASVMLARMWEAAGFSRAEADKLIESVRQALTPDDVMAHLELYGAYAEGLGDVDYEVKARRSFDHLLVAAEHDAGHTYSLTVARIYRTGSLVIESDGSKAAWWYERALEQGSPDAARELRTLKVEPLNGREGQVLNVASS